MTIGNETVRPILDDEQKALWQAFLQTHNMVLCQLAKAMQSGHDLPLTWYDVLVNLGDSPRGGLRLQDLAQAIVLSQSGLTRLLDRMESAGLVERKPCPHDRRGWYALITAAGRDVLEAARPLYHDTLEAHFMQHLSEEEREVLARALAKVLQSASIC